MQIKNTYVRNLAQLLLSEVGPRSDALDSARRGILKTFRSAYDCDDTEEFTSKFQTKEFLEGSVMLEPNNAFATSIATCLKEWKAAKVEVPGPDGKGTGKSVPMLRPIDVEVLEDFIELMTPEKVTMSAHVGEASAQPS